MNDESEDKADRRIEMARLAEDMIDKGAASAEEIHRAVGELPLAVLDNLGMPRVADSYRKIQDRSISVIYSLIREVNHQAAGITIELLKRNRQGPDRGEDGDD